MYLEHFGLREAPFRITPHTEFFFSGAHRGSTLDALIYAITHDEGIVKVSGEVGSGKTMLCRMLASKLPPNTETIYLANPSLERDEILYAIAEELKLTLPEGRPHLLFRALQDKLLEIHASKHQVVVLIDEAHAMPPEALEEIRLLSNMESNGRKLMHIVLFGQPELDKRLSDRSMRQLKERITHNFALEPLHKAEIESYLMFRMRAAGYRGPDIFTANAVKLISQASEGLTRRINILADKALLFAYSENKHLIDSKQVKSAIADAQFNVMHEKKPAHQVWLHAFAGACCILTIAFAIFITPWQNWLSTHTSTVSAKSPPLKQEIADASSAEKEAQPVSFTSSQDRSEPSKIKLASVSSEKTEASGVESPTLPISVSETVTEKQEEDNKILTLEDRIASTIEWLNTAQDSHFFIQLMSTDGKSIQEAEQFVNHISTKLEEPENIRVYRSKLSGRERIGVIYGHYETEAKALSALPKVAKAIPGGSPYIRAVKKLK